MERLEMELVDGALHMALHHPSAAAYLLEKRDPVQAELVNTVGRILSPCCVQRAGGTSRDVAFDRLRRRKPEELVLRLALVAYMPTRTVALRVKAIALLRDVMHSKSAQTSWFHLSSDGMQTLGSVLLKCLFSDPGNAIARELRELIVEIAQRGIWPQLIPDLLNAVADNEIVRVDQSLCLLLAALPKSQDFKTHWAQLHVLLESYLSHPSSCELRIAAVCVYAHAVHCSDDRHGMGQLLSSTMKVYLDMRDSKSKKFIWT